MILDLISVIYNIIFVIFFLIISIILLQNVIHYLASYKSKEGCYVLVTGCDTGFGYAIALELSKQNVFTFAGCLTMEGVRRLNEHKTFKGTALVMDVTNENDITKMKEVIEDTVKDKGLWCVINNAGTWQPGPIEWVSVDDMKNIMDVNLWGAVNVTKVMLPLVKRSRGRIINMSSIAGRVSDSNSASYSMSKYALEAFSDSLRYEMNPWGVSVHIIEPGHHHTNLFAGFEKSWEDLWDKQDVRIKNEYGEDFYKDTILTTKKTMAAFNSKIQDVTDVYMHAAFSLRPKPRYVVGLDAQTAGMTVISLPTSIGDFIRSMLFPTVIPDACKDSKKRK